MAIVGKFKCYVCGKDFEMAYGGLLKNPYPAPKDCVCSKCRDNAKEVKEGSEQMRHFRKTQNCSNCKHCWQSNPEKVQISEGLYQERCNYSCSRNVIAYIEDPALTVCDDWKKKAKR